MHFEIHVEDQSGKKALEILIPKIIGNENTFVVYPYKGIGKLPGNLNSNKNISKQLLLYKLPKLLQAYGNIFESYPKNYKVVLVIVCDLDKGCLKQFRKELNKVLESCNPKPRAFFCIAVEEMEAWFLGDFNAIKQAYPKAKLDKLRKYNYDSICGTWEYLADVVHPGGSTVLSSKGWNVIGAEKSNWAERISVYMNVENNLSPSFNYFRKKLLELIG